jgi:hypothetical protein
MSVTCSRCQRSKIVCCLCHKSCSITEEGPTFDGHYHGGTCPDHGYFYFRCGHDENIDAQRLVGKQKRIASPAQAVSDPIMDGINERAEHFNKTVTTAAVISLAFGLLIGVALGLAVASFYVSKYCLLAS